MTQPDKDLVNNPLNLPQPNLVHNGSIKVCGWCADPFLIEHDDGNAEACSHCGMVYDLTGNQIGFIESGKAHKELSHG